MGCEFRAVRLSVSTGSGDLGFATRFDAPLTVIRGGNTIGKSLLIQSMLYALGLEALYATRKGTLTRAMTSEVVIDPTAKRNDAPNTVSVVSSWIEVVLEFKVGLQFTIRRAVKPHPDIAREDDLIRMWSGDQFDTPLADRGPSDDYLIGRPGTAVQERGFHRLLTKTLGWTLPDVPTYGGRPVPLYVQEIFGLAYVDQKRGWGGTVPQVPTTFQIVDPLRKAVEYVLQLDVLRSSVRRQELTERERRLTVEVDRLRGRLEAAASMHGGRLVSSDNVGSVGATPRSHVLEILADGQWVPLSERVASLQEARAARLRRTAVRMADVGAEATRVVQLEQELNEAEVALHTASTTLAAINQDDEDVSIQLGALHRRLNALDDEYERYRQINALRELGSVIAPHTMDEGDCPTCHQSLEAVESIEANALPIADTLEALRKDRATVRSMNDEVGARSVRIAALQAGWTEQVSSARQRVRAVKTDLVAAHGTPSARDIQAALAQEQELARLQNLEAHAGEDLDDLYVRGAQLSEVSAQLKALSREPQSKADKEYIGEWTMALRALLDTFEFKSVATSDVDIDTAMRPVVDGYDIGFQGSASDGIRLRWSYLLSLAAVAAATDGAHPGFLIFDEPAQQGVETESVVSLLGTMAKMSSTTQMFVTTSEPPERLTEWLGDADYQLVDLGDTLILRSMGLDEPRPDGEASAADGADERHRSE